LDFGFHFRHEGAKRALASYKGWRGITVSDAGRRAGWDGCISWREGSERTFREFTEALLHVRHRIPLLLLLLLLLRGLLLRSITATALLRVMNGRVGALRIGEPAHLLLLLPLRDLVAGILLLLLEQQLARKLLVQLGLFGLLKGATVSVADGVCDARCELVSFR
jgi:hypothetical protein